MSPLKKPPEFNTLLNLSSETSIGFLRELSNPSKIKDNVDLAGLSQPLPFVNLPNSSEPELLEISLNNNSFLVILLTVMLDVVVDGHTLPLIITLQQVSVQKVPTPIPQEVVLLDSAKNLLAPKTLSPSMDTSALANQSHLLNPQLIINLFQSVLMLHLGLIIPEVSSLTVPHPLITPSSLLVIPTLIG